MKRVKIYRAEVQSKKVGTSFKKVITDKKDKFLEERTVMDSTYKKLKDEKWQIENKKYVELVQEVISKDEVVKMDEDQLIDLAASKGVEIGENETKESLTSKVLKGLGLK